MGDFLKEKVDVEGKDVVDVLKELSGGNQIWQGLYDHVLRFYKDRVYRGSVLERVRGMKEKVQKEIENADKEFGKIRGNVEKAIEKKKGEVEEGVEETFKGAGQAIGATYKEGTNREGTVEAERGEREDFAKAVVGASLLYSVLGFSPFTSIPPYRGGGGWKGKPLPPPNGPKGRLPGGRGNGPSLPRGPSNPPLPSGSSNPPSLPGNDLEKIKGEMRRYTGREISDEDAKLIMEKFSELRKAYLSGDIKKQERAKKELFSTITDTIRKYNPKAYEEMVRRAEEAAMATEKALVKQAGKSGAKSLLKKIPLVGLVASVTFAKERAEEGDWKGAALELASGFVSMVPVVGTVLSGGIDTYLFARDVGIIDKNVSREEFEKVFNQGLVQGFGSIEELRSVWSNFSFRDKILNQMATDPNFAVNFQGKQVRFDEEGNIYDYDALTQQGLSVNPRGEIYDVNTGKILRNIDKSQFLIGRL